MCPPSNKRQIILIQGVPSNGTFSQNLTFRFQPKKLTVRQAFISDSTAATLCTIFCRQISLDPLCVVYALVAQSGDPIAPGTEIEIQNQIFNGTYTFSIEQLGALITTADIITLVLEFSD